MTRHGELYLRDRVPARSIYSDKGRFGRLFPFLPAFARDSSRLRGQLLELGSKGGPMDAGDDPNDPDGPVPGSDENIDNAIGGKPVLTAGNTFLGQFLDHDLTFDPTSSLERQADPESVANFRTPAFELDSVYGSGRAASPHLYDKETHRQTFLVERNGDAFDLPRNSQNIALLGDPRNDENLILSQLHLAFLRFHNAVVDHTKDFEEAQRLVRWHYQWLILHDYLARIVGEPLVQAVLRDGRRFYTWRREPFIPVEFSVAAFRFGHSQVRPGYIANHGRNGGPAFVAPILDARICRDEEDPNDLRGGKRATRRFVDFDTFFDFGGEWTRNLKPNKRIDTKLSTALFDLPFHNPGLPDDGAASLAQRNLLRHLTFELPSGQAVAKVLGIAPLDADQLSVLHDIRLQHATPLWFYILKEAELLTGGQRLAGVGARIVAEVFIGLLEGDRHSFLTQDPHWKPTLATNGVFGVAELLRFAGMTPPRP